MLGGVPYGALDTHQGLWRPLMRVCNSLAPFSSGLLPIRNVAEGLPLGIYARTTSTNFEQTPKTHRESYDPRKVRAERYALKSVVNLLLPTSRTSKCMRWTLPGGYSKIYRSTEHQRAFYAGLQVCASVWACPVCAAKISERRRLDLISAIATSKAMGMQAYLLTLTVPHGLGDDVGKVVDGIHLAWKKTTNGRAAQNIRKDIGLRGFIRALEVTYGKNGFHPHLHVLLFVDSGLSPESVQKAFIPLWQKACIAAGLPRPSDLHGCKVSDGSYAASYASKWGIESEMTRTHTKKAKPDSKTPWDFLRDVLAKNESAKKSASLFRLYVETFKGRKQLYWSNGLRKLLALSDMQTDAEIVEKIEDYAQLIAQLTVEQWGAIIRTESESLILDIAEKFPEQLAHVLAELESKYLFRSEQKPVSKFVSGY